MSRTSECSQDSKGSSRAGVKGARVERGQQERTAINRGRRCRAAVTDTTQLYFMSGGKVRSTRGELNTDQVQGQSCHVKVGNLLVTRGIQGLTDELHVVIH